MQVWFGVLCFVGALVVAKPLVPDTGSLETLTCGDAPVASVYFFRPGLRAYNMTIPEGNVDIETDKPEFDEITITIKSGPLNTDGQVHSVVLETDIPIWKEDLTRGDTVMIEARATLPLDSETSLPLLSSAELLMSFGVSVPNTDVMYEFQPVEIKRDGEWHLYSIPWKQQMWQKMYHTCQVMNVPGLCMTKPECDAYSGVMHASQGIEDKTFKVSGCHRLPSEKGVQCCKGSQIDSLLDSSQYNLKPPVTDTLKNDHFALRFTSRDTTSSPQTIELRAMSICSDPCNNECDLRNGMVCNVPTASCMCKNEYPWVRGPQGGCYYYHGSVATFLEGKGDFPCQACPTSDMYTHYNSYNGMPETGVALTVCKQDFQLPMLRKRDTTQFLPTNNAPAKSSCCGFVCDCAPGYEYAAPLFGSPTILPCVKKAGTTCTDGTCVPPKEDTKTCATACAPPKVCDTSTGYCVCDTSKGWTFDKNVRIPEVPRCVHTCPNCVDAATCEQPTDPAATTCQCKAGLRADQRDRLFCLKDCAATCRSDQKCSAVSGRCECADGKRDDGKGGCVDQDTAGTPLETDKGDKTDREVVANGGCPAPCKTGQECVNNTCQCKEIYQDDGNGNCINKCDECRKMLTRATCGAPDYTCKCASTLIEKDNACVPRPFEAGAQAPDNDPFNGLIDLSTDDQVLLIIIVVSAVVCYLIICGVLICFVVVWRVRSKNRGYAGGSYPVPSHGHSQGPSSAASTQSFGTSPIPLIDGPPVSASGSYSTGGYQTDVFDTRAAY